MIWTLAANLACLPAALSLAGLLEWGSHRWLMHRRGTAWYHSHAVEHHGGGMMEARHTAYSWGQVAAALAATSPLWAGALWLGLWGALCWPALLLWWKYAHEAVHRAAHGGLGWEPAAGLLCPWWRLSAAHHLRHHERVTRNYCLLFPWADHALGTADPGTRGERTWRRYE